MTINIKYPALIRISTILVLIFILIVASIHFTKNISSATDENLFSDPPSRFYLTRELTSYDTTAGRLNPKEKISPGMLIISIDNQILTDSSVIRTYLNQKQNYLYHILFYDPVKKIKIDAAVRNDEFNSESISYLSSAVVILEVNPGGVSDRAGLKVGDLIIRINGKQFKDMFVADRYLALESANEVMKYEILRGNQSLILKIVPVKYGLPFTLLLIDIAALISIIFGAFILLKRPESKVVFFLGFGFLMAGNLLLLSASRFGLYLKPDTFSIIRNVSLLASLYLSIAFLSSSVYFFPVTLKKMTEKKWIFSTLFIMAAIFILISILNLYLFNIKWLGIISDNGLVAFLIFIIFLRIKYRKLWTEEYKRLNRPIAVMYLILLLSRTAIPALTGLFINIPMFVNYVFAFSFILLLYFYYYVIARYNLLNLNIRLRKNILYTVISFSWRLFAVLVVIALLYGLSTIHFSIPNLHIEGTNIEVLNRPLDSDSQFFYEKFILVAAALSLTILIWKMKTKVQKTLDKRFFRGTFDYRRAATHISNILAHNINLKDLTASITSELAELTLLKRVGIVIFKNETSLVAQDFFGIKNEELYELTSASGSRLVESIKSFREDFSIDYIQEPLRSIFREFGFKFIQPIYSKNKLLGALILGEKKSESSINRDDFVFLQTIAGQIAVAVDNSFLYEEITQQERMKHELEIARKIQLASLPGKVPDIAGFDISGISLPAFEVGGDFYDFLETDNNDFMVIVGDVSGKGTSAALYMSKIQGIMRTLHEFRLSPRKLLIRTNHLLYSYLEKGYFVSSTAVNFDVSKKTASISRAGHLPLYYYSVEQNRIVKIITKGMVLGLTKDKTFERNMEEDEIKFTGGDLFVLITDGITESKNSMMQEYGEDRLIRTINNTIEMSAENIRNAIIESAKNFAGDEEQFDDMTVVIVKILS